MNDWFCISQMLVKMKIDVNKKPFICVAPVATENGPFNLTNILKQK